MANLDDWTKAKNGVQKLLGPKGKLPKLRVEIEPPYKALSNGKAAYLKAVDAYLSESTKFEKLNTDAKFAVESAMEVIKQSHFDLDAKADQKKIEDARKVLLKVLSDFQGTWNSNLQILKKLDHTVYGVEA